MITSMTGFGRGEATSGGVSVAVELRTVNSRFLEVSSRLPGVLSRRENEIKDVIRKRIARGKVNLLASVVREESAAIPLAINVPAAKACMAMLNQLRKTARIKEPVKIEHLLHFSEIFEEQGADNLEEMEWDATLQALNASIDGLEEMRRGEGGELARDFRKRIALLEEQLAAVETLSKAQVPAERTRLRERIAQLLEDQPVDEGRLELEIALLADHLDVTEECVRFRSHNKFFLAAIDAPEPAGRKLNFLIQEMNREVNTIGSKSNATEIAHIVVAMKEELEKIREQLQNIE
jgi:TIGR00255 family protein